MIPDKNPYNNWSGNGSTTTFDFDFYIEDETQLAVYHTNSKGVQTLLKFGTDYSINELKNENGSFINFPVNGSSYDVLGEDEVISLCLTLPIAQENPYGKSSYLDLETLEYSLDYLTRICQIISRQMERSVKTQEGSSQSADELIEALQEAQVNAAASASDAASSASAANASAISAGEEATIATQQAAIVEETYNTAMNDIATSRQTAINDIETSQAVAASEIASGRENIASDLNSARSDINADLTNAENNINSIYTANSDKLKSEYNSYTSNLGNEYQAIMKAYDRLYKGVDLEVKFASEIATYGNVYAWLEARKNAGNYDGIHIGDYFHTSLKAGTIAGYSIPAQNFKCRIIGLNTYKSCADTNIGNMIYISTDEVIDTPIKWNPTDNNNGTNNIKSPWLASAIYAILNGVNNYDASSGYNKVAHGANGGAGIISLLPSELQAVLKQKRNILDERYSASGLLTGGSGWSWADMGKLWLPNEIEVYGCGIRSNLCLTSGFWFPEAGLSIQFPWFANNCENRIKRNSSNGRCIWWLSSVASSISTYVCYVSGRGYADYFLATRATIYAPLCFCI